MPFDGGGTDITMAAAADLSAYQYRFMKVDANGRATVCTAATDIPLGVLQNKPAAADRAARVRIDGLSLFHFGAASNEGDLLASGELGAGTVLSAGTTLWYGAMTMLAAGGSGDIQTVLVMRGRIPNNT